MAHSLEKLADEELIRMLEETDRYSDEELLSAILELERRNIRLEGMDEMKAEIERGTVAGRVDVEAVAAESELPAGNAEAGSGSTDLLGILKPRDGFFVTPVLFYMNISIFLLMAVTGAGIFEPSVEDLTAWGGNYTVLTLGGEWWRLLTACFIHSGIMHLLMNMYSLFLAGVYLEAYAGSVCFLTVYLLSGIGGSLTSLWWHDVTVSVGASGAIFGMFGFLIGLLLTKSYFTDAEGSKGMLTQMLMMVGINLLYGMKGNIDNAGHIGGLVSGLLLSLAYMPAIRRQDSPEIMRRTGISVISVAAIIFTGVWALLPKGMADYDQVMERFSANEERTLSLLTNLPDPDRNSGDNSMLGRKIYNEGVLPWEENIALLNGLDEVPASVRERLDVLRDYSELRRSHFTALQRYYENPGNDYSRELDSLGTLIGARLERFKELNK